MYNYILFDLDGTLTDPKEGITKCVQYALAACGIDEPDLDNLLSFIGPPLVDEFMRVYGMDKEKALFALAKYRERFEPIGIFENAVYPGAAELLEQLKNAGKTIVLATAKPQPYAEQILEHFGLAPYFDLVVGATMDESRNNKTQVIAEVLRILDATGEAKKNAVMIGDREHDMHGAAENGIDAIGLQSHLTQFPQNYPQETRWCKVV